MANRVHLLAKELSVTSKAILEKCRAEGLTVKNHMSTLTAGQEATIREWFSEGTHTTAIETATKVDLKTVRRPRKKKEAVEAEAPTATVDAESESAVGTTKKAVEKSAKPVPAEAAQAEEVAVEEEAKTTTTEVAVPAPAPPSTEPPAPKPPQRETLVPAPAQLRGPQVVRVVQPDRDVLQRPRPASRTRPLDPSAPAAIDNRTPSKPATSEEEEEQAKRKRRGGSGGGGGGTSRANPRRQGHASDAGERLKEWRDRDLVERSERLAAAEGAMIRARRSTDTGGKRMAQIAPSRRLQVEVTEPIVIKELSAATGIRAADIIRRLMQDGQMATINETIETELAKTICTEQGVNLEVITPKTEEDLVIEKIESLAMTNPQLRPPVVTFLGHVDHGKTSLLDSIRKADVAQGEAGGITQHVGAYKVQVNNGSVVFLDTPGHEAFTAMRARGANMTDVVVLVVAADDGMMPQTIEAINHAKAAEVPIVVALNKIDLPNANEQRVLGQLAEHDLTPQEWGGKTEVVRTNAINGEGIDQLLEILALEAELLELQADASLPASGTVIDGKMQPGRGPVANLLVRNGTLRVGNTLLAGGAYGRVRGMVDDRGQALEAAEPSTPVEVSGLDSVPDAGDKAFVVDNIDVAARVAESRRSTHRRSQLTHRTKVTLDNLFTQIQEDQIKELRLIIKGDVAGSVETLVKTLSEAVSTEVRVRILHAGVGAISEGDVHLADASNAIIIGFHVVAEDSARGLAEQLGVDVRLYRVIYEITDEITKALEGMLAPTIESETLGRLQVRDIFKVSRVGTVAGCFVTEGSVTRSGKYRLIRDGVVVKDNATVQSLRRFKDDVREVQNGLECGLKLAGFDDIKPEDVIECYKQVEVARTLG